jgi:hypothetical protein
MMRVRKDLPVPVAPNTPEERWMNLSRFIADRDDLARGYNDDTNCLFFNLLPKDLGDIARSGHAHRGMVRWDGFDRQRARLGLFMAVDLRRQAS